MAIVAVPEFDAFQGLMPLVKGQLPKQGEAGFGVVVGIQGLWFFMLAVPFPGGLFGLFHLDLGAVFQHDAGNFQRRGGSVYRPPEAIAYQAGQHADVVEVPVGEQHGPNFCRGPGPGAPVEQAPAFEPLKEAAVEQDAVPVRGDEVLRSRYRSGRTEELDGGCHTCHGNPGVGVRASM